MSHGKARVVQSQKPGSPQADPTLVSISHLTSSPFPHPDELVKYEGILPGFSQSILTCYQDEVKNRQQIDLLTAKSESSLAKTSMITTTLIIMALIGLCGFSLYIGYDGVAKAVGTTTIIAFAGVFLLKNSREKKA